MAPAVVDTDIYRKLELDTPFTVPTSSKRFGGYSISKYIDYACFPYSVSTETVSAESTGSRNARPNKNKYDQV